MQFKKKTLFKLNILFPWFRLHRPAFFQLYQHNPGFSKIPSASIQTLFKDTNRLNPAAIMHHKSIHRWLVNVILQKALWFLRSVCRIGVTPLTWLRDCGRTTVQDKRAACCRSCPWPRSFHTSRESTGWRPIKRVISGEMLPSPIPLQRRLYLLQAAVIILQSEAIILNNPSHTIAARGEMMPASGPGPVAHVSCGTHEML